jgi:hypothetical protein
MGNRSAQRHGSARQGQPNGYAKTDGYAGQKIANQPSGNGAPVEGRRVNQGGEFVKDRFHTDTVDRKEAESNAYLCRKSLPEYQYRFTKLTRGI